ncbi:ABC transporter substrate-binding protein [Microbaculum sp. FT89]|uniref:ABC transporter substrate-binding protein n=1 Tax=Microbaculum sp. FT89 TaxID=3447298 RepID=UPI003F53649D
MRQFLRIAVAATALAFAGGAAAKDWSTVRIGTEGAYPPFNFYDTNNQLQGFDIEIAQAICDKMAVKCEFVAQDWDGIIPALLANKYDAIVASMSITEERKKQVDFTDKYYHTPARFIARKESAVTDTSAEALKGKALGAQSATIHANFLEGERADSDLKLYGTQDEANMDLANGRLDAVLADSVVLYEWLENTEEGKCCEFVGEPETDPAYFGSGAGIALRKEDQDLKKMMNEALAAIIADGTYEKINDKYFPFSIY